MSGQVLARFGDLASPEAAPTTRERGIVTPAAETRTMVQLTRLARNASGTVAGVRVHAPGADGALDPADERMALRLIAFGQPGDDPIGVRVGGRGGVSTFALRRQEASCVWVWPDNKS